MAIQIVCKYCGSDDVKRDAWAEWNPEAQKWVLSSVFDEAFCECCEGSTTLAEQPLEE